MFNKELKEKFLMESYPNETTKGKVERVFKFTIGVFEDKYGKDLSEFTPEEVNNLLKDELSGSFKTLETLLPFYRQYVKFVGDETGVRNDYLATLTLEDLRNIVSDKIKKDGARVISRETVLSICETLGNPRDKVLLLGLFEGISGKKMSEFLEIRPEDVFDHHVYIRSRDLDLPISNELAKYFKDAMEAEKYEYWQFQRVGSTNLLYGDKIAIKVPQGKNKAPGESEALRNLRASMVKISSMNLMLGDFTISNLKYSGMTDRIITNMDDKQLSVKQSYDITKNFLLEQYNMERIDKQKLFRMVNSLLEEREKLNEQKRCMG